jgi:Cu-Zn family superoxide dismutase
MRFRVLALCAVSFFAATQAARADTVTAALKDANNKDVGTVELLETVSGTVLVKLAAKGLPPGEHAFHIHEKGACDAAGKFVSAGPHLSAGKSHGILHENGPHPGDLPNIQVQSDGTAKTEIFLTDKSGGDSWIKTVGLLDADGSAVVIHAGVDDYSSQPAGQAGDRIACGVLQKK